MSIIIAPIGERIKLLRKQKKISQKDLAQKLGITSNTLYRYEHGDISISLEMLVNIAKALEVSTSELMYDSLSQAAQTAYNSNTNIQETAIETLEAITETGIDIPRDIRKAKLLSSFDLLNDEGQKTAVARVEELTEVPKYKKQP